MKYEQRCLVMVSRVAIIDTFIVTHWTRALALIRTLETKTSWLVLFASADRNDNLNKKNNVPDQSATTSLLA